MGRCSESLIVREINKTAKRYHLTLIRMTAVTNKSGLGRIWGTGTLCITDHNVKWSDCCGEQSGSSCNIKNSIAMGPRNSTSGHTLRTIENRILKRYLHTIVYSGITHNCPEKNAQGTCSSLISRNVTALATFRGVVTKAS